MKKSIIVISIFLACLTVTSILTIAKEIEAEENITIRTHLHLDILDDGKLTENKILGELRILSDGNKIYADWNHVYIDPVHEARTVILKAQHFSTLEGTIKNVQVSKEAFSFMIDLSLTPLGTGRTVQVVGSKKNGREEYDVEATAIWWSEILNRKIKTEWQSTDKKIILPYKEVY